MNRIFALIAVVASVVLASNADAQRVNQIQTGVRVRVTRTEGRPLIGSFIGVEGDSVRVMPEGASQAVRATAEREMTKIEVSGGRSRAKGALIKGLIGLGIGAVSGAILGAATYSDNNATSCTPNFGCGPEWCIFICSKSQAAGLVGVLGGSAGLVLGAVAGIATGQEQWDTATLR